MNIRLTKKRITMKIKFQQGATLLELMVGLAIVAILLTSVGPSIRDILIRNRIVAQINELSSIVQFARSQAIDQQTNSIMCPSENFTDCHANWDLPKMVFIDIDNNGIRSNNEEILAGSDHILPSLYLTGPAVVVRFQGNGTVASPATLLLCHKDKEAKFARALIISLQGRVKLSTDSDRNNIHENNSGSELVCP